MSGSGWPSDKDKNVSATMQLVTLSSLTPWWKVMQQAERKP